MEFRSPHNADLRDVAEDQDWTVGAVSKDQEFSDKELDALEDNIFRMKDGDGERGKVIEDVETGGDGTYASNFRIDLDLLRKILYEHRRYSQARGFSDAEMDVLRAIEFQKETRVGVDEIFESVHASEYSQSTVYKALRTLQEKDLIEKVRPGVYQYTGP